MSLTLTLPAIQAPLYSPLSEALLRDLPTRQILSSTHPYAITFQVAVATARCLPSVGGQRGFLMWNDPYLAMVPFSSLGSPVRDRSASQMLALLEDDILDAALKAAVRSPSLPGIDEIWTAVCRPNCVVISKSGDDDIPASQKMTDLRERYSERYKVILPSDMSEHAKLDAMQDAACLVERLLQLKARTSTASLEMRQAFARFSGFLVVPECLPRVT
jgi:hypothetical protein